MLIIEIHVDNLDEKNASPQKGPNYLEGKAVEWRKRITNFWNRLTNGFKINK